MDKPNDVERLTVALPAQMASSVRAAVTGADYETASEVVQEALLLWQSRRGASAQLREAWVESKRSGIAGALNMGSILADAKAEMKAG